MIQLELPKLKQRNLWVILKVLLFVVILVSFSSGSVWAQEPPPGLEPQKVLARGETWLEDDALWECFIEVWNVGAAGGEAYAGAVLWCTLDGEIPEGAEVENGTFSGGPNGIVEIYADEDNHWTFEFVDGEIVRNVDPSVSEVLHVQNPGAFDAWQVVPITSEYIYTTYGIRVEDSFGDDQWEQKSWSDQELILLNDVLKELPPGLLSKMAVTRIIRNKAYIDNNGNPDPDTFGIYYPCGSPAEADCPSSSGTIRIFNQALTPLDFTNDPDGYKEFKGTILHELTHALQFKKDEYSIYKNPHSSPLVQNYMDATRPITNINDPGFEGVNGWVYGHPPGTPPPKWKLYGTQDNKTPTNYGNTNPIEDMSESVMMYVYEPQKLQGSSPQRYNFIRDHIFEGVEYENGTQKKP